MTESYENPFGMMRLVLVVGFFVVAYMLYNLTVSIYQNYQIERHITEFEERNEALKEENQEKLADLQYYMSSQYIDKIAKQNLNLINSGEQVVVIPDDSLVVLTQDEDSAALSEDIRASWSTPKKWWKFFFNFNSYKS